jgi:hypothetical protein
MSSPKEEAQELVDKYNLSFAGVISNEEDWELLAKQCALIAVDEILKSKKQNIIHFYRCGDEFCECAGYWQEVKSEIELL